jgi:hypothetical protein
VVDEGGITPDTGPKLTMQSVKLAEGCSEERQYALLIYADSDLVAFLAQPQHPVAKEFRRLWILVEGFGPCSGPGPKVWHNLSAFHQWVLDRCRAAAMGSEPDRPRPGGAAPL